MRYRLSILEDTKYRRRLGDICCIQYMMGIMSPPVFDTCRDQLASTAYLMGHLLTPSR